MRRRHYQGVSATGTRDEAWFDSFFRAHHAAVRGYARRRIGEADADDVVVEVFSTAWACRERLPNPVLPWLYRCAWHRIAVRHRAEARRDRLVARLAGQPGGGAQVPGPFGAAGGPAAAGTPGQGADLDWVHEVLAALDPNEAELLRLAAWEGLAPREIAAVLGCTPGAARVRLHRARRKAEALCPPGHGPGRATIADGLGPAAPRTPHAADQTRSQS